MAIFKRRKKAMAVKSTHVWARPEMKVVFRAEIMPGKTREERTYRVRRVLPNGRVELYDFPDEHREGAFEPINFLQNKTR
ncbi:MAG: hypothetical protein C4324_11445 [Blastocatellia bacterium]